MLLCLLLVSKGWCITRNTLQRREVCLAGCNLALLYAAVSVQLSVRRRTPDAIRRAIRRSPFRPCRVLCVHIPCTPHNPAHPPTTLPPPPPTHTHP